MLYTYIYIYVYLYLYSYLYLCGGPSAAVAQPYGSHLLSGGGHGDLIKHRPGLTNKHYYIYIYIYIYVFIISLSLYIYMYIICVYIYIYIATDSAHLWPVPSTRPVWRPHGVFVSVRSSWMYGYCYEYMVILNICKFACISIIRIIIISSSSSSSMFIPTARTGIRAWSELPQPYGRFRLVALLPIRVCDCPSVK